MTATLITTQTRRAWQMLWSKLDEHLLPFLKDGVVLAISGGPDSRALLEATALWSHRTKGTIVVASFDHGARQESREEARFIAMRAQRLGFVSCAESLPNQNGRLNEAQLRYVRYGSLKNIADKYSLATICTAHHGDDDAEGYMMALLGVGGNALGASMSEISWVDGMRICRPFLTLTKRDLLMPLSLAELTDFVEDRLDESCQGMRARIRKQVVPLLEKSYPGLRNRLKKFARHQQSQHEALDEMSTSLIDWGIDEAQVRYSPLTSRAIVTAALWRILKKWCSDKDLRSSQATIDALVEDLPISAGPGLDPKPNAFNLKGLSVKRYRFPGVLMEKKPHNIKVKRISSGWALGKFDSF